MCSSSCHNGICRYRRKRKRVHACSVLHTLTCDSFLLHSSHQMPQSQFCAGYKGGLDSRLQFSRFYCIRISYNLHSSKYFENPLVFGENMFSLVSGRSTVQRGIFLTFLHILSRLLHRNRRFVQPSHRTL